MVGDGRKDERSLAKVVVWLSALLGFLQETEYHYEIISTNPHSVGIIQGGLAVNTQGSY